MCGRYVIESSPQEISERFQLRRLPEGLFRTWNAAPTQELPVVIEQSPDDREVAMMRWGIVPRWSRPGERSVAPINARAETLTEKPLFRGLVSRRRCIVPMNGYYEWKQIGSRKQPYLFTLAEEPIIALAGLYDEVPGPDGKLNRTYAVITTEANEVASQFHDRMPAILRPEDEELWLSPEVTDFAAVEHALRSYPAEAMRAWPVSTAVSNVRNNDASMICPLAEEDLPRDDGEPAPKARRKKAEPEGQPRLF